MGVYLVDCREMMRAMPDCSVHAIVTDPPYEIGFMGHGWDAGGIAFDREVWREALRVLVPGGHVLAFGATRTWHWLAVAMELAGFEPRDSIAWIQGQGMPHGKNIGKAIDAATSEAATWEGWNTTLAPRHEPIVVMRKPLSERTVEANVLRWGAGALNVDACRLEGGKPKTWERTRGMGYKSGVHGGYDCVNDPTARSVDSTVGRWPPNVALDEAAARELDALVGRRAGSGGCSNASSPRRAMEGGALKGNSRGYGPVAGPSAFFYCPKAPTGERDRGCEHLAWKRDKSLGWRPAEPCEEPDLVGNPHPTVKPLVLMRWLLRLVTPTTAHLPGGGLVFDPFLGSGTTGVAAVCEGVAFIGSDVTPWAHAVAEARINFAQNQRLAA